MTANELKYYQKLKQKKFRESEDKFLIEGVHLIEECLNSKYYSSSLEKVFIREDFDIDLLIKKFGSIQFEILEEKKFNHLSETVSSQGLIGVVFKQALIDNKSKDSSLIVALDNINDPGNMGTIIRTCYWFNVGSVFISSNSVEIFNSKVIRSSQGAMFNLILRNNLDLPAELEIYYDNEFEIILTDPGSEKDISGMKFDANKKYIVVFGNEANGISETILRNKNYRKVKIKKFNRCDSLNVAVSAGIILNEIKNKSL